MNRLIVLILLCLSAFELSAQEGTWYSVNIFPNASSRRLIVFENLTQDQIDRIDSLEAARFSYSVGGAIQWRGEFLGFQIGANFVNTGYRGIRQPIPRNDSFFGRAEEYEQEFVNYLVEVPIEFTFYQSLNEKNDFLFMLGTGIGYNLSNRTLTTLFSNGGTNQRENKPTDAQEFQATNWEFQAALGWETALNDNLRLLVQPTFQFWLNGLYIDAPINRNLYALGVRVGLKFWK